MQIIIFVLIFIVVIVVIVVIVFIFIVIVVISFVVIIIFFSKVKFLKLSLNFAFLTMGYSGVDHCSIRLQKQDTITGATHDLQLAPFLLVSLNIT